MNECAGIRRNEKDEKGQETGSRLQPNLLPSSNKLIQLVQPTSA